MPCRDIFRRFVMRAIKAGIDVLVNPRRRSISRIAASVSWFGFVVIPDFSSREHSGRPPSEFLGRRTLVGDA
jgi:hypothetical protein